MEFEPHRTRPPVDFRIIWIRTEDTACIWNRDTRWCISRATRLLQKTCQIQRIWCSTCGARGFLADAWLPFFILLFFFLILLRSRDICMAVFIRRSTAFCRQKIDSPRGTFNWKANSLREKEKQLPCTGGNMYYVRASIVTSLYGKSLWTDSGISATDWLNKGITQARDSIHLVPSAQTGR